MKSLRVIRRMTGNRVSIVVHTGNHPSTWIILISGSFYTSTRSTGPTEQIDINQSDQIILPDFDCLDEYRTRCFVPGHWVTVCTGTESYAAKAVDIDDAGRLIVQREGGRTEALCHGEVSIRPSPLAVK